MKYNFFKADKVKVKSGHYLSTGYDQPKIGKVEKILRWGCFSLLKHEYFLVFGNILGPLYSQSDKY